MDWVGCAKRVIVATSAIVIGMIAGDRPTGLRRILAFEPLESRLPLSAAGLVDVGTQPQGGLSGKIVYIHGGHGYTADNEGNGTWSFQRAELFEMIEDLGNVDQMTFLADYLFRAGATVVPLRPVGHQTNEVVLDNDDAGVTFAGNWSDSSAAVYFGSAGDVPYRFATTSLTETAYARYQPNLPQAGFYPVYAWTSSGGNRATDQLYPRESFRRHHRSHGESPPRGQRPGVSRHVLFRRRHRRLRRHQQPLERCRRCGDRRHDPLRQRHGRHQPRRRRLRAAPRRRSRPVLGQMACRSLAGNSTQRVSAGRCARESGSQRSRCHRVGSRPAMPST